MNNILNSFLDIILDNFFKVISFIILTVLILIIFSYLIEINEYKKRENHITFSGFESSLQFSPIVVDVVYEHPNSNYHNYIEVDFEVTRQNIDNNSFSIKLNNGLYLRNDSSYKNMNIEEYSFNGGKTYKFIFKKDFSVSKLSIKIGGDIFGGNIYYKEFKLYFDFPRNILNKIKIKPVINAIENSILLEKSSIFKIDKDHSYYRLGKVIEAEEFYNFYFRFLDLYKQSQYQNRVIVLSIILGVFISIWVNCISKLRNIYLKILRKNRIK